MVKNVFKSRDDLAYIRVGNYFYFYRHRERGKNLFAGLH